MAAQNKASGSGSGSSSGKSSGGSGNRSRSTRRSSNGSQSSRSRSASGPAPEEGGEPDVLVDVPKLKVEELGMEVENLHAQVALEARLGELLHLHVGVDVVADRVALEMKGVEAEAQLKARLDRVLSTIERTLKTVDAHPEVLTELAPPDSVGALHALEHGANGADESRS
jgi:hypothetical protein